MIKTIKIAKYDLLQSLPLSPEEKNEGVIITITEDIPSTQTMEESAAFHEKQSDMISDALYNSLPQGTFDRLLIKLMQHKTSLYRGKTES